MTKSELRAPALRRLRVEGVRLYNDGKELDIELSKPISAFVGANGIGKSTLLALANFGLTGIVPNSSLAFPSVDEFVERAAPFAASYFSGRVEEADRDSAAVTVEFGLGDRVFVVTRGLFEGRLVRAFSVSDESAEVFSESLGENQSPSDVALAYQAAVVAAAGLANFDQFSFWQLFMMTFDERRHLLFWDEKTLQSALMISLGRSPQDAIEAESLNRNIERQDSLARNAKWRATQATNKRRSLTRNMAKGSELTDEEVIELEKTHKMLAAKESESKKALEDKEVELLDTSRSVAELAIAESELEQTYLKSFTQPLRHGHPEDHNLLTGIINHGSCDLCGSRTSSLGAHTNASLLMGVCPICDSMIPDGTEQLDGNAELISLDQKLAESRASLKTARARYHRLRNESVVCSQEWESSRAELVSFLDMNSRQLSLGMGENYTDQVLQYDREIASGIKEAENYRLVRDSYRQKLEPIIIGLVEAYAKIETVFVPNFRRLAEQFIGRTVDVEFERHGISIGLRFSLDGQSRRKPTELSESQQYFLDIALRMSLIQTFVSGECTLLVDTPEGSLDIAYETRAGLLFEQFSKTGHSLIMMSNLNASNLLSELTRLSSETDMEIFKMIEWAKLSDIQLQSSDLFDAVYDRLESSLHENVVAK